MRGTLRQTLWLVFLGLAGGLAYRFAIDDPGEASLANVVRSAVHGVGMLLAGGAVHGYFISRRSAWVRRWPLWVELALRAAAMALAITAVAVVLQAALYDQPLARAFFIIWGPAHLGIVFTSSLLIAAIFELTQLVGRGVLMNFLVGRYRRPARVERVFLFLDLIGSTALAEAMGELRMQGLLTQLFLDIDDAILAHRGEVHAYVGDEAIVAWPLDARLADGRCLACFFAIDAAITAKAAAYEREFNCVPRFRGGLHAGRVVVSECGASRRQIAYFGDTMNVAARLLEHGKEIGRRLLVSAALLQAVRPGAGFVIEPLGDAQLRGRAAPVTVFAVELAIRAGKP